MARDNFKKNSKAYNQKSINDSNNSGDIGVFFDLFENHPYGYASCKVTSDTNGDVIDFIPLEINSALGKIIGKDPESIIGKSLIEAFPASSGSPFFSQIAEIVKYKGSGHFEFWSKVLNKWLDITVFAPNTETFIATFIDISEKIDTEKLLKSSQDAFRELVENVNDVLYSANIDGLITYVSLPIKRILGYEPRDLIGKSYIELIHPEDIDRIRMEFGDVLSNNLYPSEYRMVTKTGEIKWVRTSSRPIMESGTVIGIRGVLVDITERKKAELALTQSEEQFRLLFDNAGEVIANIDKDGKFVFINRTAANFLGCRPSDVIGKLIWDVFPIEGRDMYSKSIVRVINDGISLVAERQHTIRGELRWFKTNLQPVIDIDGNIRGALIISNDIDSQKKLALYFEARLQLLQQLRKANDIDDCLKYACEAIYQAGFFKRAVMTLHNNRREITHLGQVGLETRLVEKARKAPAPSQELSSKMTQDKFIISHSFFIPLEAELFSRHTERMIKQSEKLQLRANAWIPGDELFVPIINNNDVVEGWLSVDTPFDGSRPGTERIKHLEEIVSITAQRAREIRNYELLLDKSKELEDSNSALRALTSLLNNVNKEFSDKIGLQINEKLLPALDKIIKKDGSINKSYLQVLRAGLEDLRNLSGSDKKVHANLSPREYEICMMIKAGATSGEIARDLDIDISTVKKHRENIRKKLKIANKRVNLWYYLNSHDIIFIT